MKMSRRAKRMERHHRRNKGHTSLNLVPMIDLLTVLVFFLLVNSSDGVLLQSSKAIELPVSIAQEKPENTLVIQVTSNEIVVQGQRVASVDEVLASSGVIIPGLKQELDYQAGKSRQSLAPDAPFEGKVTIQADRRVHYQLLKKVMATCTYAHYSQIALAVSQKAES
jgi:biopolymer transport protein ExbD